MATCKNTLRSAIEGPLQDLAAAREYLMANPEGCAPMISGVTHCESCGFSAKTPRFIATNRERCASPEFHPAD